MGASTDYGGSNFGIAYYGSDYRTYGPGRILAKYGQLLTNVGCSKAYSALRFTEDERVFCSYGVIAPNSGVTTIGQVADWMMVYRNDPGQTGYYWVARKYMYTWGGASWTAVDSLGVQYTSSGEVQDLSHRIPDAFAIGMPAGTAMASCNNRIFVCSGSRLYYSGYQRPFEYRVIVRYIDVTTPDDTSPGSFNKDGETLMAIAPLGVIDVGQESIGSPPNSAASLHYWTNRGFYRVSGFDATSLNKSITISPNGTLSPFSIARGRNLVYWLDEQQQVRAYGGSSAPTALSMFKVDNYTRAVTSPGFCVGWVCRDRYYLMLTSSQILVWNEDFQNWESLDVPDTSTNTGWGFTSVFNNLQRQVLLYNNTTTNGIVEHDQPESSGNVAFAITFRGITNGYTSTVIARSMWVNCDGATGVSLSTFRTTTGFTPTSTVTGTIALTNTSTRTWRYDPVGIGVGCYEVVPGFTGTVPGGWALYGCGLDLDADSVAADRA
jgi:hypothetical protein